MLLRRVFQTPHFLLAFFFDFSPSVLRFQRSCAVASLFACFFSFSFSSLPTLLYHKHIYLGVCQPCFFFVSVFTLLIFFFLSVSMCCYLSCLPSCCYCFQLFSVLLFFRFYEKEKVVSLSTRSRESLMNPRSKSSDGLATQQHDATPL